MGWADPSYDNETAAWRTSRVYTIADSNLNLTGATVDYGRRGQSPPTATYYLRAQEPEGPEPRNRKEKRAMARGLPRFSGLLWSTLRASEESHAKANAAFWPYVLHPKLPRPQRENVVLANPPRRRRRRSLVRSKQR